MTLSAVFKVDDDDIFVDFALAVDGVLELFVVTAVDDVVVLLTAAVVAELPLVLFEACFRLLALPKKRRKGKSDEI